MKKSIMAILTATIFILSTIAPLVSVNAAKTTDPASWYTTAQGNLNSDTYSLYPYDANNLTIGVSQFGELINPYSNLGLSYNGLDPFANIAYIPEFEWNQGWLINLTYTYSDEYRNVWAFALFSDIYGTGSIGGNWVQAPSPDSTTVLGGRKYGGTRWNSGNPLQIGYVTTAPLSTLYDGPRQWIALSKTTIGEDANTPLVGVYLTFVFNKDTKYVTVYKDIKLLDQRKLTGPIQVEFSNRGEWDLGKTQSPPSYADIFTGLDTAYESGYHPYYPENAYYDLAQVISTAPSGYVAGAMYWPQPISTMIENIALIPRSQILGSLSTTTATYTGNGTTTYFYIGGATIFPPATDYPHIAANGAAVWQSDPIVFVNGFEAPETSDQSATNGWTWSGTAVVFNHAPAPGVAIWIVYKQQIDQTSLIGAPGVPYIAAEWDFDLSNVNKTASSNMFRAVTVYYMTDNHDASDEAMGSDNVIDREVQYMADQVFNPWDLNSAVEKTTARWVWFGFPTAEDDTGYWTSTMPSATQSSWPDIAMSPVLAVPDQYWDQYSTFSERVIDLNTSTLCYRTSRANDLVAGASETYNFYVEDGIGYITGLNPTHYYKILYSTDTQTETAGVSLSNTENSLTGLGAFNWNGVLESSWTDALNVGHDVYADDFTFSITNSTAMPFGNLTWTYTGPAIQWEANPFVVPSESYTELETGAQNFETVTVPNSGAVDARGPTQVTSLQFNIQNLELNWELYPPGFMDENNFMNYRNVWIDGWDFDVVPTFTVTYGNATITGPMAFSVSVTINFIPDGGYIGETLFNEYIAGRYELGIVGRTPPAASVDSAGLSMISAALKDKGDEYSIAGEDMYDPVIANQMPYVMSKVGTGDTTTDYYYGSNDFRTGLKDDWCTTYPVSSANLVTSGGPLANLLAYYGNDFSTAFYGLSAYTNGGSPWFNAIVPLSCWNATNEGYKDSNTVGYAVVSTFIDPNGTEVLMVWGNWGRDTYYASQWFYQDGIREFQSFPSGVNSIILQINYKSTSDGYKPTLYTVQEMLGTISETGMYDPYGFMTSPIKGGIHPDP